MSLFLSFILLTVSFGQVKTKIYLVGGSSNQKIIEGALSEIINSANTSFKGGALQLTNSFISQKAKDNILKMWGVNRFYCGEEKLKLMILESADGKHQEIRNIPLFFQQGDSLKKQYCLVTLNATGVIEDLLIGLEQQRYEALINEGINVADQRRRQIILGFVEEYRTAYNKRDIDFIEKVFSDQALIIKGTIYTKNEQSDQIAQQIPPDKVRFTKMTKVEYINELRTAFKSISYLKVDFDRIDILRHRFSESVYGVTLFQKWQQDSYKDTGFLFLMVDFRDEDHPKIHVRAWQPDDPSGDSKFKLSDFDVL